MKTKPSFHQTSKRLKEFRSKYDNILAPARKYIIDSINDKSNIQDVENIVKRAIIINEVNGQLSDLLKVGIGKSIFDGAGL
jgi:hypothetical protein